MPTYLTPGVYYERVDASGPAISAIRTDVAGFVGIAQRGPIDTPVPVQSWRQFQAHFGGFIGSGFLAYAVRAFFENGGRRCWVVRVASRDPNGGAKTAGITVQSLSGRDIWRIAASSPGTWGNNLSVTLKETHRAQTESKPRESRPDAFAVSSTSGFARGTLVRLSQHPAPPIWKVVSDVDPIEGHLVWVRGDREARLPYDSPVAGFDPDHPILIESVEYTLLVRESGDPVVLYEGLSLVPEHEAYGPRVLRPLDGASGFEASGTLPAAPHPIAIKELRDPIPDDLEPLAVPQNAAIFLEQGGDGLDLLQAHDFIGKAISPLDSDTVQQLKRRGIRALSLVNEVSVVAVPDIHIQPLYVPAKSPPPPCEPDRCLPQEIVLPAPPRTPTEMELPPVFSEDDIYLVQAALVQHCEERRDRIALLDPPLAVARDDEVGIGAVRAWRSRFDSRYAAFYYPWLRVVDPLQTSTGIVRDIPPTGHVAGQYARTDFAVGVHKAPANAPLAWVQDVTVNVNDAVHGILNPLGINVIRPFPSRGIRIFGARTVSSDPSWRYVNVRRLLMMIEEAIDMSTQWAVFEPNDVYTRAKLRLALTSFLVALWQQGALMGSSTEEAFFVKCDEENNPPSERDKGRLLAEVGVAPSKPFEFIVLKVGRTNDEFEISELPMRAGGRQWLF